MNSKKNTAGSARDGLFLISILLTVLIVTSCTGNISTKGRRLIEKGDYVEAIDTYSREVARHPDKKDVWRDLAFAHYKKGELVNSLDAVSKADQFDPLTFLCRGLILEAGGGNEQAIKAYSEALNLKPGKKTRTLLKSHLDALIRSSLQGEIESAVAQESTLVSSEIPDNTIAVVKFDGTLLPKETAPIAAGIGEFTMVDLSKVEALRLVERLKVEILLKELELASSRAVDPAQAPRVGRLLGSKNVVTGKLVGAGVEKFRLDGALINTIDASSKLTEPGEAKLVLDDILKVQKAMVFDILEYLGVQPTQEDRDSIMLKPTESLEAFMAFSRGLEFMMLGMYEEAIEQFELAQKYDGNFDLASGQLANAQIAFDNQQFGSATSVQLENAYFQNMFSLGLGNGQMITNFIDPSDILQPGEENPTRSSNKPPQVGQGRASAAVTGNIDGD